LDDDDDDFEMRDEREKSPSPPKNDLSVYLHIENLVRPFTIGQLKGLIGKTGVIADDGFWINNIKSHCFVKLCTEEEATATREALHGLRWPSGNPKVLKVDFAVMSKMFSQTEGQLGEKPKVVVEIPDEDETEQIQQKQRHRKSSESRKSTEKPPVRKAKREESPVKLLDYLFRKTKATPCIYWLPLSDEEIAKRQAPKENLTENDRTYNRKEKNRSPERRRSAEKRNRSPDRRNRSPIRRSRSPDRRRSGRGWR